MPTSSAVVHALIASAAITTLASCSGGNPRLASPRLVPLDGAAGQSILAQPASGSFFNPTARGKPLIFASDPSLNVVDIYLQATGNAKVGEITGDIYGPYGLATDGAGDVYIADSNSETVIVFAPPYTNLPKLTLDDTGNQPVDVAVSARGLVAVANFNSTVTFYRANSNKPCVTVADPSFGSVLHDVFDDAGNLYIDGENGTGFLVGEIRGGCDAMTFEILSTGNITGNNSGGIKINKRDQIAIEDDSTLAIYAYNRPTNGTLGNPITTTPLTGSSGPYDFAFSASGRQLYTADYLNRAVEEFAYPAGGNAEDTISVGAPTQGVAVTPPLVP